MGEFILEGVFMDVLAYISSLNPDQLMRALPGSISQGLIWGIMAIGVYLTYKILDFADLTVDGSICTGGAICTMALLNGENVLISCLLAILGGMLAGLVTGLLHTWMGIPPILSGILTQLALWSINLVIMGKANQAINANQVPVLVSLGKVKSDNFFETPIFIVSIFIIILVAILYWFFGTEIGAALRATGANPNMSRAQGVNTKVCIVIGLMLSNGLVALAGALLAQYQGFSDVSMGRGAIVIGLAAVIIGGAIFGKIFKNFGLKLIGVVFGSIIYYVVIQFVLWLKLDPNYLKMLSAMVVAIFLAVPYWQKQYAQKHVKGVMKDATN